MREGENAAEKSIDRERLEEIGQQLRAEMLPPLLEEDEDSESNKKRLCEKISSLDPEDSNSVRAVAQEVKMVRNRPKQGLMIDMGRNDPAAFTFTVDTDIVPSRWQDFVATHETNELVLLKKEEFLRRELQPHAHVRATFLELEAAQEAGLLDEYESWFENTFRSTILPRMERILGERLHPEDVAQCLRVVEQSIRERQEIFQKFKQAE